MYDDLASAGGEKAAIRKKVSARMLRILRVVFIIFPPLVRHPDGGLPGRCG
jgi:hypothetical protein